MIERIVRWQQPVIKQALIISSVVLSSFLSSGLSAQNTAEISEQYPEVADLFNAFDVTQAKALEEIAAINADPATQQVRNELQMNMKLRASMTMREMMASGMMTHEAAMEMGMGIVDAFPLILKAMKSTKAAFVLPKGTKVKTASQSVSSKTSKYIDDEIEALSKNSSSVSDSQLRTMAKNDEHFEFLKGFRNSCKGVRSEMCDEFHKGLVVCSICSTCK